MTTYTNYFSALVGLSDSVVGVSIVINFALSLTLLWTRLVIAVFLNNLTMSEMQSIYQRGWIFLCNSLLYWGTVNGDLYMNPFNLGVCLLSILVIFVLHWVCRNRVRGLQAVSDPQLTWKRILTISRLGALCLALFAADVILCYTAVQSFRQHNYALLLFGLFIVDQLEMSISFCSEFAINSASLVYLHLNPDEDDWEPAKMLTTMFRLLSSTIAIAGHGLFIYVFGIRISDMGSVLGRLMRLYHNVSSSTKVATAKNEIMSFTTVPDQAVLDHDSTCVICREEMSLAASNNPKMAPRQLRCGHAMHGKCLIAWISQSATCPTCRSEVRGPPKTNTPGRPAEQLQQQPLNEQALNDRHLNEQPRNEQPRNEQPLNDQPLNDQPINDQLPSNELPSNQSQLNEEPLNGQVRSAQLGDQSPVDNQPPSNEQLTPPAQSFSLPHSPEISSTRPTPTIPAEPVTRTVPTPHANETTASYRTETQYTPEAFGSDTQPFEPRPFETHTPSFGLHRATPPPASEALISVPTDSDQPKAWCVQKLPSRTLPLLDLANLSPSCDTTVSEVGNRMVLNNRFEVEMQ